MLEKAGDIQFRTDVKAEDEDDNTEMMVDSPVHTRSNNYTDATTKRVDRRQHGKGRKSRKQSTAGLDSDEGEQLEEEAMNADKPERVFNKRTMRDQYGNYPQWMHKRKVRTQQKKNRKRLKRIGAASSKK